MRPIRYRFRQVTIFHNSFIEVELLDLAPHSASEELFSLLLAKHNWNKGSVIMHGYWDEAPWEAAAVPRGIDWSLWENYKKARLGPHREDIKVIVPWTKDQLAELDTTNS